jgi:hypothetical protein
MNIKLKLFPRNEFFFGIRVETTKLITDINSYNKNKDYPHVYIAEIGLIFLVIETMIKGGN